MSARIPVFIDQNGIFDIAIFQENEDGSFSRTPEQPLRQLRANIQGVSNPIGTLVSRRYDRSERPWHSPTALPYSGRPQSFYNFVRENLNRRRIIVATVPSGQGKSIRLFVNELKLKPTMGQGSIKLFMNKYLEAIHLWHEQAEKASPEESGSGKTGKPQSEPESAASYPSVPNRVASKPDHGLEAPAPGRMSCQERMATMSEEEIARIRRLRKFFGH